MVRFIGVWLLIALAVFPLALPAADGGKGVATPLPREVDLKTRMKALIGEALKAGDLWTAIQADAFATSRLGVRSSGLLGASEIIGDPLFAFPHMISSYHQRGDTLVVVSGARIYRLGLDGHPLAVPITLPFVPDHGVLSRDGRFLALLERQKAPVRQLKVSVVTMPAGSEVFSALVPLVSGDAIYGPPQIAEDGSAVVVTLIDSEETQTRLQVVRGSGKSVAVPGYFRPLGVGVNGAWALAEPLTNREADERVWMLLAAGQATPLLNCTAGPGLGAVITQEAPTQLHIVLADGSLAALPLPLPLERKARVASVGEYLVLSTGWPSAAEEVDLLGNPIAVATTPTTMLFRWSDLVQPATAKPVLTLPGVFGHSQLTATLVFMGAGTQLSQIDLTQAPLAAKPLLTAPREIRFVDAVAGRLMLWLGHDERLVASEDGHVLWHGPAVSAVVHDPWFLEVRGEDHVVDWVRLAEKPEERLVTRLKLPNPGTYDLELDRYHRRLVASAGRRDWHEFDPLTGKPVGDPLHGEVRPRVVVVSPREGGLMISQAARLVPRLLPPEDESTLRWNPLDAWRVGPSLVVLDHHGQVYVAGRKRGTYPVIGSVDHALGMGQTAAGEVVMADDEHKVVAGLAAGPALVFSGPAIGTKAEPFPEGPWRVKNLFFIPPRGPSLVWDAIHCGFTPSRLRSPLTGGMLAVTDSLVFDLDPALGRQLGVLDKAGLRDADD